MAVQDSQNTGFSQMYDASTLLLQQDLSRARGKATPLVVVSAKDWPGTLKAEAAAVKAQAQAAGFEAAPLSLLPVIDSRGQRTRIYVGAPQPDADGFALGALAGKLPQGHYAFQGKLTQPALTALGWCLEQYKFDPFNPIKGKTVSLETPRGVVRADVIAQANAVFLVRDLVNMPANILGPNALEAAARKVAIKAKLRVVKGDALARGFPLIHTVGAAASEEPRLVDFTWGNARHPKVTLVGKGVCFDTGGLDIKPSSNMLLMKKDMGGAATVLGLAQLIMGAKLPVRLRVLLPIVENSISDEAFRPGDVYRSRKGLTVEIGNTDAEGRLILADALALADEEAPDLLIDMATLTGAARVALGPDLPPFYTDDDAVAQALMTQGFAQNDPVWRLPLWRPYHEMITSPVADLNNAGQGGFAGSITAALFLRRFVEKAKAHVHFDIFAWTPQAKPGRPKGGEAQALRAVFGFLRSRYGR
jgi:leucyl aminopeptidase